MLVGAIVSLAFQSNPDAREQDSLLVLARANGGSAGVTIDVCGPLSTIESIVEPSSLIVRGVVRSTTAKLSPDETRVVTEIRTRSITVL